jgi:hypothetical protein
MRVAAQARGTTPSRVQYLVLSTVVAQLLPAGPLKGGSAIAVRRGLASRFSTDIDATLAEGMSVEEYANRLDEALRVGWSGFTGTLAEVDGPVRPDVPEAYSVRSFSIAFAYRGKHLAANRFELGPDELGLSNSCAYVLAEDCRAIFRELGLPEPEAAPVLDGPGQLAQKLHACSSRDDVRLIDGVERSVRNDRARDLVDIQLLDQDFDLRTAAVREICCRIFAARGRHTWPPTVRARDEWPTLYESALNALPVTEKASLVPSVDEAVDFVSDLIRAIDATGK